MIALAKGLADRGLTYGGVRHPIGPKNKGGMETRQSRRHPGDFGGAAESGPALVRPAVNGPRALEDMRRVQSKRDGDCTFLMICFLLNKGGGRFFFLVGMRYIHPHRFNKG